MSSICDEYQSLLNRFLNREVSAEEFQQIYLDTFSKENRKLNELLYQILDGLFWDVDAFCSDPVLFAQLELDHPGFYLDENRLRERVAKAIEQLTKLKQRGSRLCAKLSS